MLVKRRCEWCDWEFLTDHSHKRFCTPNCTDAAEYWRRHIEPYELPEVVFPKRPFIFCRTGYCSKCPEYVNGVRCICEHHGIVSV